MSFFALGRLNAGLTSDMVAAKYCLDFVYCNLLPAPVSGKLCTGNTFSRTMTQTAATEAPDTTNLCCTEDIEMRNIFQSIIPTLAELGDVLPLICDASLCFK